MEEQIKTMPVVALRGLTILPKMVMHFDITRPRSMAAVEKAMIGDQRIFLVTQKHHEVVEPELDDLYQVGTIAVVKQMVKLPKHVVRVLVEGLERGELLCFDSEEPALIAQVGSMDKEDEYLDSLTKEAMLRIVKDKLDEYGQVNAKFSQDVLPGLKVISSLEELLDQIAIQMPWDYTVRQGVLESNSLEARYEVILRTLMSEMEIYRIKKDFRKR